MLITVECPIAGCGATFEVSTTYDSGQGQYPPTFWVEDVPEKCPGCGASFTDQNVDTIKNAVVDAANEFHDWSRGLI